MPLTVNGQLIDTNKEGFLINPSDWSKDVGIALAQAHSVELTEDHWDILNLLRDYCATSALRIN